MGCDSAGVTGAATNRRPPSPSQKIVHAAIPAIPAPMATGAQLNGAAATGTMGTGGVGARRAGRSAPTVEGSFVTGVAHVTPSFWVMASIELLPTLVRQDGPSASVALPFFTSTRSPGERPSQAPICANHSQ